MKFDFNILIFFGLVLLSISILFVANSVRLSYVVNDDLDVFIQDQHSEIIDLKLHRLLNNITLLHDTELNSRYVNITSTTAPTPLLTICFHEGTAFYQGRPTSVVSLGGNAYSLKMDSPLDFAFTTDAIAHLSDTNLAVDGSVTPIIFEISPEGLNDDVEWDITRIIIFFGGEGIGAPLYAPDDSDFGVTGALTNGMVLRSIDGITKNIFNAKTNGDFRARVYDLTYTDASKNGVYGVTMKRTFAGQEQNGVTIRLKAKTNDKLELIVQDDLTEMTGGQAIIQGHVVEN